MSQADYQTRAALHLMLLQLFYSFLRVEISDGCLKAAVFSAAYHNRVSKGIKDNKNRGQNSWRRCRERRRSLRIAHLAYTKLKKGKKFSLTHRK
jgi:hypothetical protein